MAVHTRAVAISYGELLARNVRSLRARIYLDQEPLAARMRSLGFTAWRRQTVARIEQGQRRLTADEIPGLALALETTMATLMAPTRDDPAIKFSAGVLDAESVRESAAGYNTEPVRWEGNRPVFATAEPSRPRHIRDEGPVRIHDKRVYLDQPEVAAAIVTSDKGVLVGRRHDGMPPWTFIAGEIEPGEPPEETVVREVKEETGCEVRAGEIISRRVHPKTHRRMVYVAAVPKRTTQVAVGDEAELAEVRWVSLAEADELMPDMYQPVRDYLARQLAGLGGQR
jgi:8-oxo-dGTP diphosphatase